MLVYFDTCAVQRPLDDLSQLRVRLEADAVVALIELCETGLLQLVASAVHDAENAENPYPDRHAHAADVLSLAARYVPTTSEIVARAAEYERDGIKRLDALDLASAVYQVRRFSARPTTGCFVAAERWKPPTPL